MYININKYATNFTEQVNTHIVVQITSMKKKADSTWSMTIVGFRPNIFNKQILRGMTAEETHGKTYINF